MKINKSTQLLTIVYLLGIGFWLGHLFSAGYSENYGFLIPMTLLPLMGGLYGIGVAQKWGGLHSSLGRALGSISLGVLNWGIGMLAWDYYILFTNVDIPYPSLADFFFVFTYLIFWPYGVYQLYKVIGVNVKLRSMTGKILSVILAVFGIALSYFLLIVVARNSVLDFSVNKFQLFFDLVYPMSGAIIFNFVAVAFVLSKNFLGGKFKLSILLLFIGFMIEYFADFNFSYANSVGSYFNGHISDVIFFSSLYVLSVALSQMNSKKVSE